ncbi:DUF3006 domain-containing protein [Clostridium sp. Marseille-P299]|uniref:DUF3006 domain-containing protein n=1 Tax=Clostridium sp. Marseille-P299 TaxID=1805477 RepID=UPI0008344A0A|nr:DUF3006 domain-containing protein [Clostridium sp. Marseille-P299]
MKVIIDRFEGAIAICEDETKNMISIPKYKLPLEVKEGDCIIEENGFLRIDNEATKERKSNMKDRMSRLFE